MYFLIVFFLVCFSPLFAHEEEFLSLRRIAVLVEEKDYSVAKRECEEFISKYPKSEAKESLYALLCDLSLQEKEYAKALQYFDKIKEEKIKHDLQIKKWQTLYELKHFAQLKEEISPHAPDFLEWKEKEKEVVRFFYAESLFKEALLQLSAHPLQGENLLKEALAIYKKIEDPTLSLYARNGEAEGYKLLGDYKDAAKHYLALSEKFPEYKNRFLLERAKMALFYDKKEASSLFTTLAEKGEEAAAVELLFVLIEQKESEKLLLLKKVFLSSLPKTLLPFYHYSLGMIHFQRKEFKEAKENIKLFFENRKGNKEPLLIAKGRLCFALSSYATGETIPFSDDELRKSIKICEEKKEGELAQKGLQLYIQQLYLHKKLKEAKELAVTKLKGLSILPKIEALLAIEQFKAGEMTSSATLKEVELCLVNALTAENTEIRLSLSALLLLEKEYKQAATILDAVEKDLKEHASLITRYQLLRAVAASGEGETQKSFYNGEKVLSATLPPEERTLLYLTLYNTALREESDLSQEKAANYLLEALKEKAPITINNRLWLAYYLFDKALSSSPSFILASPLEKAIAVFEQLFEKENPLQLQSEAMKLFTLYQKKGATEKAKHFLEEHHFKGQAELALANLYLKEGNEEKAFAIYQNLEKDPLYALPASLQSARLKMRKKINTGEIADSLDKIVAKRAPATEPLHIEAGIDLVELKAPPVADKGRELERLSLLRKLKDTYEKKNDPFTCDYHSQLKNSGRKEKIVLAYCRFIDAEILFEEAKVAKATGNLQEAARKQRSAKALLSSLRQEKYIVTETLQHWIERIITSPEHKREPEQCPLLPLGEFSLASQGPLREYAPRPEFPLLPLSLATLSFPPIEMASSCFFGEEVTLVKKRAQGKTALFSLPMAKFDLDFYGVKSLCSLPLPGGENNCPTSDLFDLKIEVAPKKVRPGYVFKISLLTKNELSCPRMKNHITFLLDRSSSISRSCYIHYRKALFEALHHLGEGDTFNILIFDNAINRLSDTPLPFSEENLDKARRFLERHSPGGIFASTDIYASLSKIVPQELPEDVVHSVILLSNGESYLRQENQRKVIGEWTERNGGRVSLFIVSTKANLPQLELFSRFNKGSLIFAKSEEEIGKRLHSLMESIKTPLGKSIIATACTSDKKMLILLQPKNSRMPILYHKKPFVIYGSTNHLSEFTLFLQGQYQNHWFEIKKRISLADANAGLYSLENEWTQLLAEEYFERFFKDGKVAHLEQAKVLLDPLHLSVPFL